MRDLPTTSAEWYLYLNTLAPDLIFTSRTTSLEKEEEEFIAIILPRLKSCIKKQSLNVILPFKIDSKAGLYRSIWHSFLVIYNRIYNHYLLWKRLSKHKERFNISQMRD
jgi:hypothetical protein